MLTLKKKREFELKRKDVKPVEKRTTKEISAQLAQLARDESSAARVKQQQKQQHNFEDVCKNIDSLSQIISESDSEGKESTKRGSCDGDYQINQSVPLLRPLSLDKVTLKDISLRHQLNVKTEQNGRLVKLIS